MKQCTTLFAFFLFAMGSGFLPALVIDHNCLSLPLIPASAIEQAKNTLHIAYTHTSHGSQITTGMADLDAFMGGTGLYCWNDGPLAGYLDIHDYASGWTDLGHNGDLSWYYLTQEYLNDPAHNDVNVVMWSWCGGCSDNTYSGIQAYLNAMNQLESQYPDVHFVYMTGHLDIWNDANLKARNQQIRSYCIANNKILFDFADIETYNPEGVFYQYATDSCEYYADGYGSTWLGNWGTAWQNSYPEEWYYCEAAHTEPVNANLKAYAAWWMWATLAGWNAQVTSDRFVYHTTTARNYPAVGLGLQFTGSGNSSATKMTMAKIAGNPGTFGSLPEGIAELNGNGYWSLHSSRGSVGNFSLTLNLTGLVSASDFPEVAILMRTADNAAWINVSSQVTSRSYPYITVSGLSSFGDFTIATPEMLAVPIVQNTSIALGVITLNWNPISGAASYQILSSETPAGIFSVDSDGTFAGTSWSCQTAGNRRFYKVVARN